MKEKNAHAELAAIRVMMERSSKFISISGVAGICAGVFALAGAWIVYRSILRHGTPDAIVAHTEQVIRTAIYTGIAVLLLSILTSYWFSLRKARRKGESVWNPVSRRLLAASGIPFITGGLVMIILLTKEQYNEIGAMSLLFYGLALIAGSQYTFTAVRWLGIGQVLLGLMALYATTYSLHLWALGFGVLHILYGTFMHFKYEK